MQSDCLILPTRFLKINPRNKVPALQNTVDGTVVYESAICNEYLSDYARQINNDDESTTKGGVWKLMPVNAADRAAVRLLNEHVDTVLNPAIFTLLMSKDAEKDAELTNALEDALDVLQDSLVSRGGPFLLGPEFSLADIHVLPFILRLIISLQHYKGYEIQKSRFGPLVEWYDHCSQRSSVHAASKTKEQIIEVYDMFMEIDYTFGGLNKNKL